MTKTTFTNKLGKKDSYAQNLETSVKNMNANYYENKYYPKSCQVVPAQTADQPFMMFTLLLFELSFDLCITHTKE